MSLSWFFSNKKKTLDTEPQQHTAESGDYIFVDEPENQQVKNECGGSHHYPALPYSLAPGMGMLPHTSTQSTVNTCHQNFLYGVPFKLYPDNMSLTPNAVNMWMMGANEAFLHISQLNLKSFEYDFLVEKSVVLEAGYRSVD
jgi:hypothetical protein